jgi:hypothetical protein
MKIKPIASNMTELVLNDGTQVLFSYETPVACWIRGKYYKTETKWSKTTTSHIRKWGASVAIIKPQDYFDNLINGA